MIMLHFTQAIFIIGGLGCVGSYITLQRPVLLLAAVAFIGTGVASLYFSAWWPLAVGLTGGVVVLRTKAKL